MTDDKIERYKQILKGRYEPSTQADKIKWLLKKYRSQIPKTTLSKKQRKFNNCPQFKTIAKYGQKADKAKESNYSLIISGVSGCGKTQMTIELSKFILKNGFTLYYTTAEDIRRDFDKAKNNWLIKKQLKLCLEQDFLVIDDLGRERIYRGDGNSYLTDVESVIRNRNNVGLPVILVTDLGMKELSDIYNKSTMSLFSGRYKVVFCQSDVNLRSNDKSAMNEDMGW